VHPQALRDLPESGDGDLERRLLDALDRPRPSLVAIGECGLDFRSGGGEVARERQITVFDAHLAASRRTGMPLVLHCVRAHGALSERLLAAPTPPAILHAFSGSPEVATALCRAGHYISFAGSVTLPNARRPRLSAAAVARDRLLIETDSPDQTPYARRTAHDRNEPAFLVDIARAVAAIRGVPLEEIARVTTENACRALKTTLS